MGPELALCACPPASISPGSVPSGTSMELSSAPAWLQRQLVGMVRCRRRRGEGFPGQGPVLLPKPGHPGEGEYDKCLRACHVPRPGAGHLSQFTSTSVQGGSRDGDPGFVSRDLNRLGFPCLMQEQEGGEGLGGWKPPRTLESDSIPGHSLPPASTDPSSQEALRVGGWGAGRLWRPRGLGLGRVH